MIGAGSAAQLLSLGRRLREHTGNFRVEIDAWRRSETNRELVRYLTQTSSRDGQKKSTVSRKNNRAQFELWICDRYNTKKNEHEQKNHGHPKYSYGKFRIELMKERSQESSAYADYLKPKPKRRFISAEWLRRIVERVTSEFVKKSAKIPAKTPKTHRN